MCDVLLLVNLHGDIRSWFAFLGHLSKDHGQMGTSFGKVIHPHLHQMRIKISPVQVSPMSRKEEQRLSLSQHQICVHQKTS